MGVVLRHPLGVFLPHLAGRGLRNSGRLLQDWGKQAVCLAKENIKKYPSAVFFQGIVRETNV